MNGPMYVELLKEKLKLHMHVHSCTIVMQDGAPCRRLKTATDFLQKKIYDLCAGMAGEQPRSHCNQEPLEYYKGYGGILAAIKR